jgi:flavin-binding protein dodecin
MEVAISDSIYKVIDLVENSKISRKEAAQKVIDKASKILKDLRFFLSNIDCLYYRS